MFHVTDHKNANKYCCDYFQQASVNNVLTEPPKPYEDCAAEFEFTAVFSFQSREMEFAVQCLQPRPLEASETGEAP